MHACIHVCIVKYRLKMTELGDLAVVRVRPHQNVDPFLEYPLPKPSGDFRLGFQVCIWRMHPERMETRIASGKQIYSANITIFYQATINGPFLTYRCWPNGTDQDREKDGEPWTGLFLSPNLVTRTEPTWFPAIPFGDQDLNSQGLSNRYPGKVWVWYLKMGYHQKSDHHEGKSNNNDTKNNDDNTHDNE